jgi:DNA topoisomerase-1
MLCAVALAKAPPETSQRGLKRQIAEAMREAARALGNTAAVCRSSYVHPGILEAHHSGDLHKAMALAERRAHEPGRLKPHEQEVVRLLRRLERAKAALQTQTEKIAVAVLAAAAPL